MALEQQAIARARDDEQTLVSRHVTRRDVALLVLAPLAIFLLVYSTWRLSGDLAQVRHSHAVIDEIINARASARQSREALHRYLSEGDQKQVQQYKTQTGAAWHQVWRVKEMTQDNPRQKANSALFEQQLGDMFKLTDQLLAEKSAGHPRSAEARVEAEEKINDSFRLAVGAVVDEERRILAEREATLTGAINLVQLCAAICAVGILVLGWLVWTKQ